MSNRVSTFDGVIEITEPVSKRAKLSNTRQFVESIHLSTLLAAHGRHFAKYSEGRTNVTQLVPKVVWRSVYKEFLEVYPSFEFAEETLKKKLTDEIKSLRTGTSTGSKDFVPSTMDFGVSFPNLYLYFEPVSDPVLHWGYSPI
jgi:hypothetical protein